MFSLVVDPMFFLPISVCTPCSKGWSELTWLLLGKIGPSAWQIKRFDEHSSSLRIDEYTVTFLLQCQITPSPWDVFGLLVAEWLGQNLELTNSVLDSNLWSDYLYELLARQQRSTTWQSTWLGPTNSLEEYQTTKSSSNNNPPTRGAFRTITNLRGNMIIFRLSTAYLKVVASEHSKMQSYKPGSAAHIRKSRNTGHFQSYLHSVEERKAGTINSEKTIVFLWA